MRPALQPKHAVCEALKLVWGGLFRDTYAQGVDETPENPGSMPGRPSGACKEQAEAEKRHTAHQCGSRNQTARDHIAGLAAVRGGDGVHKSLLRRPAVSGKMQLIASRHGHDR